MRQNTFILLPRTEAVGMTSKTYCLYMCKYVPCHYRKRFQIGKLSLFLRSQGNIRTHIINRWIRTFLSFNQLFSRSTSDAVIRHIQGHVRCSILPDNDRNGENIHLNPPRSMVKYCIYSRFWTFWIDILSESEEKNVYYANEYNGSIFLISFPFFFYLSIFSFI